MTLRNRIIFAAHPTNLARDNLPSQGHALYYAQRAKGGAGLIVIEEGIVHPSDFPYERAILAYREEVVPAYRRLGEVIHQYGAVAVAQLNHNGGQANGRISRQAVWAPSAVPDVVSLEVPKVMEAEDISEVVAGFAQAAGYARQAGLDGVEVNAGQYSLIRQFLSPLTNHRADAYGGSLENRLRFCRQVVAAVREAVGPERVVGLRLCGDELAPWAGLTPADSREIGRLLAATGQLDYIGVDIGSIYTLHMTWASMFYPQDYALSAAAGIRQAVDIPVCTIGGIVDPVLAEEAVAQGQVDLVEMTRALIADPELPRKAQDGQMENIRPCLRCNEGCLVRSLMNPIIGCIHNPAAGHEGELAELDEAPIKKSVMVVGGGPAGLEAARVAALRGHQVSLYEKEVALGGKVRLAARGPGRGEMAKLTQYLETQIEKLGVRVELGVEVTPERVVAEAPDVIVVATGSVPGHSTIPGAFVPPAVEAEEVLGGKAKVGERVLVIDEEGSYKAASVAELLADQGKQVEVVTKELFVSPGLASTLDLVPWYQRALSKGIVFTPQTAVRRIAGSRVEVEHIFSRAGRWIEGVDTVVLSSHPLPHQELYFSLKWRGFEVYRAGDCVAPRKINHAIFEGHQVGRMV